MNFVVGERGSIRNVGPARRTLTRILAGGGQLAGRHRGAAGLVRAFQVFVVQPSDGPQQATSDQIEVTRVVAGFGVVTERRAEDAGAVIVVGPDHGVGVIV